MATLAMCAVAFVFGWAAKWMLDRIMLTGWEREYRREMRIAEPEPARELIPLSAYWPGPRATKGKIDGN